MPFINDILKYDSLSIIGMEKNTGKTECLNYILRRLPHNNFRVAVTSIGIDGESKDQVKGTNKPEIFLREGIIFSTDEKHYLNRKLVSEILEITKERSSMGRILTANVIYGGNAILGGPSSANGLRRWVNGIKKYDVNLTIVDGALSRLSSASAAISKSLILSTGASVSANISTLVQKTKHLTDLINLPLTESPFAGDFIEIEQGIFGVTTNDEIIDLNIKSSLALNSFDKNVFKEIKCIFLSGALTDRFLSFIVDSGFASNIEIIVKDFTKIFINEATYRLFINKLGKITVLYKSKLIAVCVNPVSPAGYVLDSNLLCSKIYQAINIPVYDIVKNNYDF